MSQEYSYLIMMAVYNGEQYISQQIESILNQTVENWKLIIQDDGSNDSTCEIIKQYIASDSRISLVYNETTNHGPYQNYNILINKCRKLESYDFYLFCDQDDFWDANKLAVFTKFYEEKESDKDKYTLIYGDMRIVDSNNKTIFNSLNEQDNIERSPLSLFFDASVWGCNFFINRALFMDIIEVPDDSKRVWGHDQYFAKWAAIKGQFMFMPYQTMSYRRHSANVTSDHQFEVSSSRVIQRLKKIEQLAFDHAVGYKSSLHALRQLEKTNLNTNEKRSVTILRNCIEKGGMKAAIYFVKNHISLGRKVRTLSHLVILVLGMHKKFLKLSFDEDVL